MKKPQLSLFVVTCAFIFTLLGIFVGRNISDRISLNPSDLPQSDVENSSIYEGKVNINTATLEYLDSLPGIGEVIAQRIIDYRNENGPFKRIEDLKNVYGIADTRFNEIKDYITVGGQS